MYRLATIHFVAGKQTDDGIMPLARSRPYCVARQCNQLTRRPCYRWGTARCCCKCHLSNYTTAWSASYMRFPCHSTAFLLVFVCRLQQIICQKVKITALSLRNKASPFYICHNFVRCHSILPILGRNTPQGIGNKYIYSYTQPTTLYSQLESGRDYSVVTSLGQWSAMSRRPIFDAVP